MRGRDGCGQTAQIIVVLCRFIDADYRDPLIRGARGGERCIADPLNPRAFGRGTEELGRQVPVPDAYPSQRVGGLAPKPRGAQHLEDVSQLLSQVCSRHSTATSKGSGSSTSMSACSRTYTWRCARASGPGPIQAHFSAELTVPISCGRV